MSTLGNNLEMSVVVSSNCSNEAINGKDFNTKNYSCKYL